MLYIWLAGKNNQLESVKYGFNHTITGYLSYTCRRV